MSITPDLMLAILAMDAYNRGYNAGLGDNLVGLGLTGRVGAATINTNVQLPTGSQAASFFAISYTWNGQTVISYRGTDEGQLGTDILTGYPLGASVYNVTQGNLAIDFYKSVNGGNATQNTNIQVTGHSLGGGPAGYVGSLYGLTGQVFDNMAFERAAYAATNDNTPMVFCSPAHRCAA